MEQLLNSVYSSLCVSTVIIAKKSSCLECSSVSSNYIFIIRWDLTVVKKKMKNAV